MYNREKIGKVCLCVNDSCPKRKMCYRFMHKGGINYSYNEFVFGYRDGYPVCKYFMTIADGKEKDA